MNCFCPKCRAIIAHPIAEVPAEGVFLKCPECSAGLSLQRETFARRALHNGNMISCIECGSQLGQKICCQNCNAIYPDYLVTETSSATRKKWDKLLASLKDSGKKKTAHVSIRLEERTGTAPAKPAKGTKAPGKPLTLIVTLIILMALISGGGYYYYQDKLQQEYATKYVRAIYGIKTAGDHAIKINAKLVNDWRASLPSPLPQLTSQEMKSLAGSKSDLGILLKRIDEPPTKLAPSREAIKKYHESYLRLTSLTSPPPESLDSLVIKAKTLEDDFVKTGKELKAGLHPKIADKLSKSLEKYSNLKEL